MEAIAAVLPDYPFFKGLSQEAIQRVAMCGRHQSVAGGTALFYEGDYADTFYVVLKGRIDLRIHRRVGSSVLLDSVSGGNAVDWSWLVEPRRRIFDTIAVQDTSLLAFDGHELFHLCEEDPRFGYTFLTRVTQLMHQRFEAARKHLALDPHGSRDGSY